MHFAELHTFLFVFVTYLHHTNSESVFINSVHDVVNSNPECHKNILIQTPLYHSFAPKNPCTIKRLSRDLMENSRNKKPFSVLRIRGINCFYSVLLQTHKLPRPFKISTSPNSTFGSIPYYLIEAYFFTDYTGKFDFQFRTRKVMYFMIFTRIQTEDLPNVEKFLKSKHLTWQIGFVLFPIQILSRLQTSLK